MSGGGAYWAAEARFDWRRFVEQHDGALAVRGRRDEYLLPCPDCGKEKLAVNVDRRAWHCFTCASAGRDATSLVAKVQSLRWYQAIEVVLSGYQTTIGQLDRLELRLEGAQDRPVGWVPRARPYPESWEPVSWVSQVGKAATGYCWSRGISDEVIRGMHLGVCSAGRYAGRVMFPVFDLSRLVFFQGRAMFAAQPGEKQVKTLSPRLDEGYAGASDVLLNLDVVTALGIRRVLLVEGPVDCAHAWPDAVASFGKVLSARQIELLMRAGVRELDLCFDQDPPRYGPTGQYLPGGAESMRKLAPLLADIFTVRIVTLPQGTDPGDLTKSELERYRRESLVWGTGDRISRIPFLIE